MDSKRVFVLGAGFSKQAGMPLATDLTPFILEKFKEYDLNMLSWFGYLEERIKWLEKSSEVRDVQINIEQLFDLAQFDVEAWRMEQQRCNLDRNAGDTPWNTAESIETWLSYMENGLIDVIWDKQKQAQQNLDSISNFSGNVSPGDVILTFNYDTLLENSLSQRSKVWWYGFTGENGEGTKILKMHGSINWAVVPRGQCNNFGYPLLFRKEDKNRDERGKTFFGEVEYDYELIRIPDESLATRIENIVLQLGHKRYEIGITGLGSYKPLHKLPGSGEVWVNAIMSLREAEEIYIIGFSLSPFDTMARLHFAGVMCKRAEKKNLPSKVVLIDPKSKSLAENFHSVFGQDTPIETIEKPAEQVDWSAVLG
jgi:hypothetical protein